MAPFGRAPLPAPAGSEPGNARAAGRIGPERPDRFPQPGRPIGRSDDAPEPAAARAPTDFVELRRSTPALDGADGSGGLIARRRARIAGAGSRRGLGRCRPGESQARALAPA
jgi:hypothetical protein